MRPFRLALAALAFSGVLSGVATAEDLPSPTGEIILDVTGLIGTTNGPDNDPDKASFDLAMLQAMDPVEITTSTIWTEGVHSFTGVPLNRLVEVLGVTGGVLKMTAINDYMVEVPVSDAVEGGPVLAYAMDGEPMSVRDKGPVWLIYPFDGNSLYQSEVYYSRSIWQLNRIEASN